MPYRDDMKCAIVFVILTASISVNGSPLTKMSALIYELMNNLQSYDHTTSTTQSSIATTEFPSTPETTSTEVTANYETTTESLASTVFSTTESSTTEGYTTVAPTEPTTPEHMTTERVTEPTTPELTTMTPIHGLPEDKAVRDNWIAYVMLSIGIIAIVIGLFLVVTHYRKVVYFRRMSSFPLSFTNPVYEQALNDLRQDSEGNVIAGEEALGFPYDSRFSRRSNSLKGATMNPSVMNRF